MRSSIIHICLTLCVDTLCMAALLVRRGGICGTTVSSLLTLSFPFTHTLSFFTYLLDLAWPHITTARRATLRRYG